MTSVPPDGVLWRRQKKPLRSALQATGNGTGLIVQQLIDMNLQAPALVFLLPTGALTSL